MLTRTSRTGRANNSAADDTREAVHTAELSGCTGPGTGSGGAGPAQPRSGFTLIELLAVILIMGLAMALVLPNLGARQTSALRDQAIQIAAQLELARQLAVVTGYPHRMFIDVESGAYRLEWFGDPGEEVLAQEAEDNAFDAPQGNGIDLSPPNDDHLAYRPVASRFGGDSFLEADFFFEGLDTEEGWFDSGEIQLVFQRDGTTDAAKLVIADDNGNSFALEVRPLLDTVRVFDEADDANWAR